MKMLLRSGNQGATASRSDLEQFRQGAELELSAETDDYATGRGIGVRVTSADRI